MVHISPQQTGTIDVARGGTWCRIRPQHRNLVAQPPHLAGTVRGRVSGFSNASRSRLIQKISQTPRSTFACGVVLITLTYPRPWPTNPCEWKANLDSFLKRLRRLHPGAAIFWKLEPQREGAPHFHLLVLGVRFIPHEWTAQAWYEVVGSHNPQHLAAGTRTEAPRSSSAASQYAAKYAAKGSESDHPAWTWPGRWWGVVGRDNLHLDIQHLVVGPVAYESVHRVITSLKQIAWERAAERRAPSAPYPDLPLSLGGWWRLEERLTRKLLANDWRPG